MSKRLERLAQHRKQIRSQLWKTPTEEQSLAERKFYSFLRICAITWAGITENRMINRAAALSFSTLLGLGPMIALMVLVSGFVLEKTDENLAIESIYEAIRFIAPQVDDIDSVANRSEFANADELRQFLQTVIAEHATTADPETVQQLQLLADYHGADNESLSQLLLTIIEDAKLSADSERAAKLDQLLAMYSSNGDGQTQERLTHLLETFIEGSQSGAVGVVGLVVLILIVIQLFSTVEGAFNDIWGVRQGRSWTVRIGMYWTVLTLGTVLAFAGLAIVAAQEFNAAELTEGLPGSEMMVVVFDIISKVWSGLMIVTILAIFYRFIPNTYVTWKAAFAGSLFTVICLIGNQALAIFYVQRVTLQMSLYGSVGIIPVLMFGLFVFWLLVLLGGRLTFAIQNAHFKSDKIAWDELSFASQESLALLLFIKICRRFNECVSPLTAVQLAETTRLPVQFINSALTRLCEIELVSAIPPSEGEHFQAYKYQPAKPLDKIDLLDFKHVFESYGHTPDEALYDSYDSVVRHYHHVLQKARTDSFGSLNVEDALNDLKSALKTDKGSAPAEPS